MLLLKFKSSIKYIGMHVTVYTLPLHVAKIIWRRFVFKTRLLYRVQMYNNFKCYLLLKIYLKKCGGEVGSDFVGRPWIFPYSCS